MQSVFQEVKIKGIQLKDKYNFFINVLISYWDKNSDETNEQLLSSENAKTLMVRMYDLYNTKEDLYDKMNESKKRTIFTNFIHEQLLTLK